MPHGSSPCSHTPCHIPLFLLQGWFCYWSHLFCFTYLHPTLCVAPTRAWLQSSLPEDYLHPPGFAQPQRDPAVHRVLGSSDTSPSAFRRMRCNRGMGSRRKTAGDGLLTGSSRRAENSTQESCLPTAAACSFGVQRSLAACRLSFLLEVLGCGVSTCFQGLFPLHRAGTACGSEAQNSPKHPITMPNEGTTATLNGCPVMAASTDWRPGNSVPGLRPPLYCGLVPISLICGLQPT